jgi:hypothetical protein
MKVITLDSALRRLRFRFSGIRPRGPDSSVLRCLTCLALGHHSEIITGGVHTPSSGFRTNYGAIIRTACS